MRWCKNRPTKTAKKIRRCAASEGTRPKPPFRLPLPICVTVTTHLLKLETGAILAILMVSKLAFLGASILGQFRNRHFEEPLFWASFETGILSCFYVETETGAQFRTFQVPPLQTRPVRVNSICRPVRVKTPLLCKDKRHTRREEAAYNTS